MRRALTHLLLPLLALLAAGAITGCGGSGGGGSSSTTASAPPTTTGRVESFAPRFHKNKAPAEGGRPSGPAPLTRASARAAERHAKAVQAARHRALARKAGRAAPFLVPAGDNSVPTYGSESSDSQRAGAEASLRSYLEARAAGDWSGACAQMAATVQKQLALLGASPSGKSSGCAAAYAKLSSRIPASARANPLSGSLVAFRVKGTKAFALFYGPKRQQYMMPMVGEGGAWRVNQIEAIRWPIGSTAAAPGSP